MSGALDAQAPVPRSTNAAGLLPEPLSFDNAWVRAVDAARRRAPGWLWAVLALLVAAGAVALGRSAAGPLLGALHLDPGPLGRMALVYALVFGTLWLAALAGIAYEGRALWRVGVGGLDAGVGLLLGGGLFLAAVGLVALGGHVVHGEGVQGAAALGGVAAGLLLTAFQAGAEEAFFRGLLQPVLCARWGVGLGLAATALVFAALHLVVGERSVAALANLVLGGLAFGLLALRSGGLWASFAAHLAWNWTESCGLGLTPNPGVGPTGALVDLDITGAGLWSGGGDAMNGSLATSLVLLAWIALLLFVGGRRGR